MFECPHQNILCPAQGCQFINNVDTVIIYLINCYFVIRCIAQYVHYCTMCQFILMIAM